MKKILNFCFFLLLFTLISLFLIACNKSADNIYTGERQEFNQAQTLTEWREKLITQDYKTTGEGVVIDGKMNEAVWNDTYKLVYTGYEKIIEVSIIFGEDGLYAGVNIVNENEIYYNEKRSVEHNTGIELYIAPISEEVLGHDTVQIRCEIDGTIISYRGVPKNSGLGISYFWKPMYVPAYAKADFEGGVNTGNGKGFSAEIFIAWNTWELTKAPEKVKLFPAYNYSNTNSQSSPRVASFRPYGGYDYPQDYYVFDRKGYLNSDERIKKDNEFGDGELIVGDGETLLAKSSAWDFSEISDGKLHTTDARSIHYIYFKDINEESYIISATIKHNGAAYGDTSPRTGLLVGAKNNSMENFYTKNYSAFLLSAAAATPRTVSVLEDPAWEITHLGDLQTDFGITNNNNVSQGEVKLTAVKKGSVIFYFVNDRYIASRAISGMAGKTIPGLITIGSNSSFTNLSVKTGSSEVDAFLESEGLYIVSFAAGDGGSLSGAVIGRTGMSSSYALAVKRGESVKVILRPYLSRNSVYSLSSVKVNGNEKISEVESGELLISNVIQNMTVTAEFNMLSGKTVTGIISSPASASWPDMTIKILRLIDFPSSETSADVYEFKGVIPDDGDAGKGVFSFALVPAKYKVWVIDKDSNTGPPQFIEVKIDGTVSIMDSNGNIVDTVINLELEI